MGGGSCGEHIIDQSDVQAIDPAFQGKGACKVAAANMELLQALYTRVADPAQDAAIYGQIQGLAHGQGEQGGLIEALEEEAQWMHGHGDDELGPVFQGHAA